MKKRDLILVQYPRPGERLLRFCGDRIVFTLEVPPHFKGSAFVRTNLGKARISRREIIAEVESGEPRLGRDWFDIPMKAAGPGRFEAVLGLAEVGHFEAKCLFLPEGGSEPLWPAGENTVLNVEPADTCCGNIIYNAFVRQFGPAKNRFCNLTETETEAVAELDRAGYTVIPPSGTFRDLMAELDFIMLRLGCRIIQLLPIHPTPTTYARMGRFGSPYASLSFTDVDPALAEFDPAATPLEQFLELVDAVHARRGKLFIDIAINHTGWAAELHESHPEWLCRNHRGEIEAPGAWGVVWADLTRLDYSRKDLWIYMAEVFLTWCRRGVDGFRCDAGYMIPLPAWRYIIAKVREEFPDTVFLLEGLGGEMSVTIDLLNRADFNWAYSELFQNYDRAQIENYLSGAFHICRSDGLTVHFAETHDNPRLAAVSTLYARMRTALCALLSPCGAFGFANGLEWFAVEKINVHHACGLNWNSGENQVDAIARLTAVLKTHPAFGPTVELTFAGRGEGNFIALSRRDRAIGRTVLVLANLDCEHTTTARWDAEEVPFASGRAFDLISSLEMSPLRIDARTSALDLPPGQVCCLTEPDDPWLNLPLPDHGDIPPQAVRARLHAKVLQAVAASGRGFFLDPDEAVGVLRSDPVLFCRRLNENASPRVVRWNFPSDLRRHVLIPPGHFTLVRADAPFRIRITDGKRTLFTEENLKDENGGPFILVPPIETPAEHRLLQIEITRYTPGRTVHSRGRLLLTADGRNAQVKTSFSREDCRRLPLLALDTDGYGAAMRVHADWRNLNSTYDALLAANPNPDRLENRRILLTRCRAWVVFQGYSQALDPDCLERFGFDFQKGAWWRYRVPTGQGEHTLLQVTAALDKDVTNTFRLTALRLDRPEGSRELADDRPVTLIIRPDIEDRSFHRTTKAYCGPERSWPQAVAVRENGFAFAPSPGHRLEVTVDSGRFVHEPEWYYMVHHPLEAERGLDPDSDLFGPGYFSCPLRGGGSVTLTARMLIDGRTGSDPPRPAAVSFPQPEEKSIPLGEALESALDHYVTRTGKVRTVVAGYPWFLDWGRDTLIVTRGLIAAGRIETAESILLRFARFEENGTMPNMINGEDTGNRDTSDTPLWFFTACSDLLSAQGHDDFLKRRCAGRTIRRLLTEMAETLIAGTPNGIAMDPATGLIFSPAHFTWMDTFHPAGTPRQGYPVEIQALWFAALQLLSRIDKTRKRWRDLAYLVRDGIRTLFRNDSLGCLVDCLHAEPGRSAKTAAPDDALRPNQLLALTLDAVDDFETRASVLNACSELLVPGAVRTLADRPVRYPLEIRHDGKRLNDPLNPYWGNYTGDENTRRKPAYHNGTAWTWLFPSYCESLVDCYGPSEKDTALALLSASTVLINRGCVGHVPEIVDGDAPHRQRGCDAQAWGVSELLRVWKKVSELSG